MRETGGHDGFPVALERIFYLKKMPTIGELPGSELALVAEHTTERFFSQGSVLFEEGQPMGALDLIIEGTVSLMRGGVLVDTVRAGDAVGALGVLSRDSRGFEARAETDVRVLEIETDALFEVFEDSFAILHAVLRDVCRRMIDTLFDVPRFARTLHSPLKFRYAPPMDFVERIRFLREVPVFARSSINALSELSRAMTEVRFEAGTTLWKVGEPSRSTFLIVDGSVSCEAVGRGFSFELQPGDPVGALEAMAERPRWYEPTTKTPVFALQGNIEGLLDVFEDNHEMALDYLAVIAGYLLRLLEARGAPRPSQDASGGPSDGRPELVLGG